MNVGDCFGEGDEREGGEKKENDMDVHCVYVWRWHKEIH
jgi:hypothetical protein